MAKPKQPAAQPPTQDETETPAWDGSDLDDDAEQKPSLAVTGAAHAGPTGAQHTNVTGAQLT